MSDPVNFTGSRQPLVDKSINITMDRETRQRIRRQAGKAGKIFPITEYEASILRNLGKESGFPRNKDGFDHSDNEVNEEDKENKSMHELQTSSHKADSSTTKQEGGCHSYAFHNRSVEQLVMESSYGSHSLLSALPSRLNIRKAPKPLSTVRGMASQISSGVDGVACPKMKTVNLTSSDGQTRKPYSGRVQRKPVPAGNQVVLQQRYGVSYGQPIRPAVSARTMPDMEQCSADSAIDAVDASRIPQPARTEDAIQHPNIHFHIAHRGSRLEAPKPQRPGRDFNSLDDTQQPHIRMRSSITIPTPVSIDFSPSVLDASALHLGERPPMRRQSTLGAGTKVPSLLQPGPRAADEKAASSTYTKQLPKHDKPLPPVPQVDAAHLRLQTQLARPDGPQRAHTFDTSSLSPKRNPTTRYTEFVNDISAKIDPALPPNEHYETKRYLVHQELRAMAEESPTHDRLRRSRERGSHAEEVQKH